MFYDVLCLSSSTNKGLEHCSKWECLKIGGLTRQWIAALAGQEQQVSLRQVFRMIYKGFFMMITDPYWIHDNLWLLAPTDRNLNFVAQKMPLITDPSNNGCYKYFLEVNILMSTFQRTERIAQVGCITTLRLSLYTDDRDKSTGPKTKAASQGHSR